MSTPPAAVHHYTSNVGYRPEQAKNPQQPSSGSNQPGYNASRPQTIQKQPTKPMPPPGCTNEWMNKPLAAPNCPRGLQYLSQLDQLLVVQKVELTEVMLDFETENKFSIKNSLGQKVFFAAEESDACTRSMCGSYRAFVMRIFDNYKNEVIHLNRQFSCGACCGLEFMAVSAPPGNVIGTIEQESSSWNKIFAIKNSTGDTVLRIEAPFFTFSVGGDVDFKIVSLTGVQVGKISKQWSGLSRELFTDADFFGITFPMDLDVRMKAVLLGAIFLIDAVFYED